MLTVHFKTTKHNHPVILSIANQSKVTNTLTIWKSKVFVKSLSFAIENIMDVAAKTTDEMAAIRQSVENHA